MELAPQELQRRMHQFAEEIKRAGAKITHQRMEIFREVARTGDHPDAETVYARVRERMPTISLDTVYRTLWLLRDLGLITTLGPARERVRFDANVRPHHHFICTTCGLARDVRSERLDRIEVPEAVREMGSVDRTCVEFRGVCSRCSDQDPTDPT